MIFLPQGEFVAYGALTLAHKSRPASCRARWLAVILGIAVVLIDGGLALKSGNLKRARCPRQPGPAPGAAGPDLRLEAEALAALALPCRSCSPWASSCPGPLLYRLVFQPIAEASSLVLLIVAVALHMTLIGLGTVFFGAESVHPSPSPTAPWKSAPCCCSTRPCGSCLLAALIAVLYVLFERTVQQGPARHRPQPHRRPPDGHLHHHGRQLSLGTAAFIGALSGVLVSPMTTLYYDSGFLIGLKGFVGAIIGGLASYPVAALGAVLVSLLGPTPPSTPAPSRK